MADVKTKKTTEDVAVFIAGVSPKRQAESALLISMMEEATGHKARMWGTSIVGFGDRHYKYESGREGDTFLVGFSPRKAKLSLYIMPGFSNFSEPLSRLGKHTIGKSCLYINKLGDVDLDVLKEIVQRSVEMQGPS